MYNRITFKLDGLYVKGILLAEYDILLPCYELVKKKFLFFSFNKNEETWKKTKHYMVFVPWKHSQKEIMIVHEKQIVSKDYCKSVEWTSVDSFVSKYTKEMPHYFDEYVVENYKGYNFIYENNSFIADLRNEDLDETTKILYKHLPKLLEEEFDEYSETRQFPMFVENSHRDGTGYIELQYDKSGKKSKRIEKSEPKNFEDDSLFIGIENLSLFESEYMPIFRKVKDKYFEIFSSFNFPLDSVRIIRSLIKEKKPTDYEVILKWLDTCIENGYSMNFLGI